MHPSLKLGSSVVLVYMASESYFLHQPLVNLILVFTLSSCKFSFSFNYLTKMSIV